VASNRRMVVHSLLLLNRVVDDKHKITLEKRSKAERNGLLCWASFNEACAEIVDLHAVRS